MLESKDMMVESGTYAIFPQGECTIEIAPNAQVRLYEFILSPETEYRSSLIIRLPHAFVSLERYTLALG